MSKALKKRKLPSPREQRAFAKQFGKDDWDRMCESPSFIEAVDTNLSRAQHIGIRILRGDHLEPDDTFEVL